MRSELFQSPQIAPPALHNSAAVFDGTVVVQCRGVALDGRRREPPCVTIEPPQEDRLQELGVDQQRAKYSECRSAIDQQLLLPFILRPGMNRVSQQQPRDSLPPAFSRES